MSTRPVHGLAVVLVVVVVIVDVTEVADVLVVVHVPQSIGHID